MEYEIVNLLKNPPSEQEFLKMGQCAGTVQALLNPAKSVLPEYQQHVAGKDLDDHQLAAILSQFPDLLFKPLIFDRDSQLVIGFVPDRMADIMLAR